MIPAAPSALAELRQAIYDERAYCRRQGCSFDNSGKLRAGLMKTSPCGCSHQPWSAEDMRRWILLDKDGNPHHPQCPRASEEPTESP